MTERPDKSPEQMAKALRERRARQAVEGPIAMREYQQKEADTRFRTKQLRQARLARQAAEKRERPMAQKRSSKRLVGGPGASHENQKQPEKSQAGC